MCAGVLLPSAATLASLASNEVTAAYVMAAPGDSVAKAMLALLEVEDNEGFSNAGGLLHQWQGIFVALTLSHLASSSCR
jgi:hypothetical protein